MFQTCGPDQILSKATLLAILPSDPDTSRVIVPATGQILDVSHLPLWQVEPNLSSGKWVYYENLQPRRMLLSNPNWRVISFQAMTRNVCVSIQAPSGMRMLNFTLPELAPKF